VTYSTDGWTAPVATLIANAGRRGGFLVAFPEYRPQLVEALADELGLEFWDYRIERMAPLGWQAGQLPMTDVDQFIWETLTQSAGGVVVHNVEALLAAKSLQDRRDWFAALLAAPWQRPVIVPVAVFQPEMPVHPQRIHRLDPDLLPPETILGRLASQ